MRSAVTGLVSISQAGYWSGLSAAAAATAFAIVQLLQVAGFLTRPLDEILIYGTSLLIVVPFVMEMLAFHHLTEGPRRYWTHAALVFTIIYAVFVTANYVVQLATVIPARGTGQHEAMRLLEQAPHSMFWDYDAIGYISMGLAILFAIPALGRGGPEKWVRGSCIAHALATPLISVVYFYPTFSTALLMLGLPWAITAPLFMWMLARLLRTK
jgi:hypothetical protein